MGDGPLYSCVGPQPCTAFCGNNLWGVTSDCHSKMCCRAGFRPPNTAFNGVHRHWSRHVHWNRHGLFYGSVQTGSAELQCCPHTFRQAIQLLGVPSAVLCGPPCPTPSRQIITSPIHDSSPAIWRHRRLSMRAAQRLPPVSPGRGNPTFADTRFLLVLIRQLKTQDRKAGWTWISQTVCRLLPDVNKLLLFPRQ